MRAKCIALTDLVPEKLYNHANLANQRPFLDSLPINGLSNLPLAVRLASPRSGSCSQTVMAHSWRRLPFGQQVD
ncbi:hypothetical protein CEP51_002075 [Fusarium floridanum]|uniref:Uncharacterized protein n=1 Tax=Fusarium floridanum TaxID=1325733 RepID=A0A428SD67_9HYPO|nr:hypothetical protein CEP53_005969 [Fusarium sp. AF-6]RSL87715.1 hypothetical protein CEP51_002075 [Fusarium floridanum]